jgi:hypothetical protein
VRRVGMQVAQTVISNMFRRDESADQLQWVTRFYAPCK